ncbi:hypothetical protein FWG86_00560 [Candidatus Saccharibacteria bacterium]|nr:hypothetical protein [Candidatus Saccharibacteria bacterium]
MNFTIQEVDQPLFPDTLLPPERRDLRGKILIIGGSSAGFAGVNYAYTKALALGAGEVKVLLPKYLEKLLPQSPDFVFAGDPKALGLSTAAQPDLQSLTNWADGILLIGDFGKNSQTQQLLSHFLSQNQKPLLATRDAIDLTLSDLPLEDKNLCLFLTFPQLQKLLKTALYPKILTHSTPLPQIADALHKFTITYPCRLATFANPNFLVAASGQVIATPLYDSQSIPLTKYNPLTLWAGEPAVKALLLSLWSPKPPIASIAESIL